METVITNTVASVLDEREISYENLGNGFRFTIDNGVADFEVSIRVDEDIAIMAIIAIFPIKISDDKLDKMYKFINDLNYNFPAGYFVIDSEDGELSLRLSNNVKGGAINKDLVDINLSLLGYCINETFEDIMKALYGGEHYTFSFDDGEDDYCE